MGGHVCSTKRLSITDLALRRKSCSMAAIVPVLRQCKPQNASPGCLSAHSQHSRQIGLSLLESSEPLPPLVDAQLVEAPQASQAAGASRRAGVAGADLVAAGVAAAASVSWSMLRCLKSRNRPGVESEREGRCCKGSGGGGGEVSSAIGARPTALQRASGRV